jgi:carbonic anhydrase/acetyltransferase-like protein (isoleucine patch superfamily)
MLSTPINAHRRYDERGAPVNLFEYEGVAPTIAEDAWIAPTATVIGDVTIESGASIWYGATLRGDDGPIIVRAGANVQDGSVIHTTPGVTTEVGPGATVAHQCMIHGAVLEEESLVANGCVVLTARASGPDRWSRRCRSSSRARRSRPGFSPPASRRR